MVHGRYIELVKGGYKPTYNFGGITLHIWYDRFLGHCSELGTKRGPDGSGLALWQSCTKACTAVGGFGL